MKYISKIFLNAFFLSAVLLFATTYSIQAQNVTEEKAASEEKSEEQKVCTTRQDAEKVALERVPGRVVDYNDEKEGGKFVHAFEIEQDNGSVMDVELFAEDCKIFEIEANKIEGDLTLPGLEVTMAQAKQAAIKEVEKNVDFARRPRVEKSNVKKGEEGKEIEYVFHVKEGRTTYVVAVSGKLDEQENPKIISFGKEIDD